MEDGKIIEEVVTTQTGETVKKRYTKGRLLGKGGFARVYELTHTDTHYSSAAKVIPKQALAKARAKQKLMSEIRIHRALNHTNVVAFEHFFEDTENVYILLELCRNQTLSDLLRRRKRLTELEVVNYAAQTISGLQYLHKNRVIHRDIKLGNLFLTDRMELKIGDFGLATMLEFDGEKKRTICGTPNYIAPEVLESRYGHSYEVDVWSLGVVIYTLLVGKPPFETSDVKTTYKRIKQNVYSFPEHIPLSNAARGLITRILHSDPAKRPGLSDILGHEFFTKYKKIPQLLPPATLAIPPSRTYYEEHRGSRATSPHTDRLRLPRSSSQPSLHHESKKAKEVWVTKWVDYTNKYGLGYLLSNGLVGVWFNDATKLVLDSSTGTFLYVDRSGDAANSYSLSSFPVGLNKKITLLQHFKECLGVVPSAAPVTQPFPYVKKWANTDQAMVFRLSSKAVQVSFIDKTELLLCSDSQQVIYQDQMGARSVQSLESVLETGSEELRKRLRYAKEVLAKMLGQTTART